MIAYQQLNFGLKSKNIMLIEIVAYSLIALQIPLVLSRSQSQNPYYNSYLQNQHRGDTDNLNTYPTTHKSLYPTLYPQNPNTTPQPYYAKGLHPSYPHTNYLNRNSSHNPTSNTYGTNNSSSLGWNANFNPYTTSPQSTYQPYGQFSTVKPSVTTLPPFYPSGSFNQYNKTNPTFPASNRNGSTHPSSHHYNSNPTYPPYQSQNTLPPYTPSPNPSSNYRPQPTFPNNPTYPASNKTSPTYPSNHHYNSNHPNPTNPPYQSQNTLPPYTPLPNPSSNYHPQPTYPASNKTSPTYPSNHHYNSNHPNPTYPPYQPQNTLPPYTPSPNPSSNYRPQPTFPNNPTYPAPNKTSPTYPSNHHYNTNQQNPTKGNNVQTSNGNDIKYNQYNPLYGASAPSLMPSQPTYDQNGTPLATFATFHANQPIDDYLFNYDNLHRRRPPSDMQSGQFQQSNQVPLAPFPGEKAPVYDSFSNVPLAPFPG